MESHDFIDVHCHLIPALDDGAKDFSMALQMAQSAITANTRTVFCTPHHLNGAFSNSRAIILEQLRILQSQLLEAGIDLQLVPGSELHLVPELPAQILAGEALTYADLGQAALVELPKHTVPLGTEAILERLLLNGITPIIAHPERNAELARNPNKLAPWIEDGCKLQLTAQSCAGDFGKPIQQVCHLWCKQGWVHLIASDAHRPHGRMPDMRMGYQAVMQWLDQDSAQLLTVTNPGRLLIGEPLLNLQPIAVQPSVLARLRHWLRAS